MFGPSQDPPLPHAMTEYLEFGDQKANVIDSEVWLEIENESGEFLTVQRSVKGTRNRHLVTAFTTRALSSPENRGLPKDYFVREPGAAVSDRGFHAMLAQFVGWKLPLVPRF